MNVGKLSGRGLERRLSLRAKMIARAWLAAGLCCCALAVPALAQTNRSAPQAIGPATRTTNTPAAGPARETAHKSPQETARILAVVNGEQIGRQELATECLRRYGKDVLEIMIHRRVIEKACKDAKITITDRDVNAEIKRMADKFKMTPDRWLQMLEQERGITVDQYREEILWPTLALRQLASAQLEVTQEELQTEWEATYGPKVKVRIISVKDQAKAEKLYQQVKADLTKFGEIAKNHSEDPHSASAHGLIPPIGMHLGEDPDSQAIEQAVFKLQKGQLSKIVKSGERYHIFLCEQRIPEMLIESQHVKDAQQRLIDKLHDDKLRAASTDMFAVLQKKANLQNVYNSEKLTAQYPGVAAIVNNQQITIAQLAEECISRHGAEVLEGEVNRKILTQEMNRRKLAINDADLDAEIRRAATAYGFVTKNNEPDLDAWEKSIMESSGATMDLYIRDAVWPSVVLKKLVGKKVQVSDEDLKKGFEANYGERVEALAIVLDDQRQAQRVWELARNLNSDEDFARLATQYSVDPISRGNDGRVPPIRQHSGQPKLEEAAFKTPVGQISGLITIDGKSVILKVLGRTKPVVEKFETVKGELQSDIYEKKLRIAMSEEFDRLRKTAQIDNFLANTSQDGKPALGPEKPDTGVKPASATRPLTSSPRIGTEPTKNIRPVGPQLK